MVASLTAHAVALLVTTIPDPAFWTIILALSLSWSFLIRIPVFPYVCVGIKNTIACTISALQITSKRQYVDLSYLDEMNMHYLRFLCRCIPRHIGRRLKWASQHISAFLLCARGIDGALFRSHRTLHRGHYSMTK
jgi:hypothetical protein